MTELYLDGHRIVLPKEFQITAIHENSFLTKKGEYTYDLTLPLNDPINNLVFKHIGRFNSKKEVIEFNVILICDNVVIVNGIGTSLAIENNEISVQLMAGNSELNYFVDENLKVQELNLGSVSNLNLTNAVNSLFSNYPDFNYVAAPLAFDGGKWNNWPRILNGGAPNWNLPESELCIQPYFLYYIKKIIENEKLGYQLTYNELENDSMWKKLYIVNRNQTLDYVKILPNWTVIKFIEEVEKLGNVVFVVDKDSKSIRILRTYKYYQAAGTTYINDNLVLDSNKVELSSEAEAINLNYKNVKYNLPNSREFFKYQCLSDEILSIAKIKEYNTFDELKAAYPTTFSAGSEFKKMTLFKILSSNNYYIVQSFPGGGGATIYGFQRINMLKDIKTNSTDSFIELDIIPSELYYSKVGTGYTAIPYISNTEIGSEEISDINEYITNGVPDENFVETIQVAMYEGVKNVLDYSDLGGAWEHQYPISMIDSYSLPSNYGITSREKIVTNGSLRLSGPYGLFGTLYKNNAFFDTSEKYEISLLKDKKLYEPRNLFVIKNKKFICEKLEYEVTYKGLSPIVKGTFYPMD